MSGIKFRYDLRKSDSEAVRKIVSSTGFFNSEEIEIAVELADENLAAGDISGYCFVMAEISGKVVGYSCYGKIDGTVSSYDLYWIAVDAEFRNNGYGVAILDETVAKIKAACGKRIYAETSSKEQYIPTQRFYEKNGFVNEALIKDFYAEGDGKIIYTYVI